MITKIKNTFASTWQYLLAAAIFIPLGFGAVGLMLNIEWLRVWFMIGIIELVAIVISLVIIQTYDSFQ